MAKINNVKSLEEHYLLKDPVKPMEASENTEHENTRAKKPEIKLETAPADYRFPTTNQSRHCFSRYVEYHRCVAAKGEGAPECDKFAKYYRSLCPGEWVDRWNEQRENGTFPGPL
ncbi:putative cytochrome-c oxidase [Helianthus annuus]|uniref:Cytochrome-c oxidase n=1 Tax=Helianthus annuus TaxID=4232 RepID=A0A251TWZ5_HELAN|nr:cytochrome c oxidase subunit 6b-3 [Helianthus annuus]KAF5790095.1 putative cytochrome-c oxidase [Helianthus annuus]